MFKHLFKLIWNKRKQNFLLITEILVSFMVIFAIFSLIVNYYQNYKKPMGFDYDKVWVINYNNNTGISNIDSLNLFFETLRKNIVAAPQVEEASYSSANIPLSANTTSNSIDYKNHHLNGVNGYTVGDTYAKVLNMKIREGRWFGGQDAVGKTQSVVINNSLRNELFGKGKAIGELLGDKDNRMRIVGVVDDVKAKGDYQAPGYAIYNRLDTGAARWVSKLLVKVSPTADAAFESQLYKSTANFMKNSNIEIERLTDKRKSANSLTLVPMIILLVVASFLIINVALGLFGVLWYNINKRKGEIGLRRAIGASGNSVSSQLVTESMILATLALIIGTFFAVQFPLLNVFDLAASVYIIAIILSVVFIYVLVLACSLYPGKQAAAILPAVALHEE